MKNHLNLKLFQEIQKKFEIICVIDSFYYDSDVKKLENVVKNFKDFSFSHNQRILIFYHDTGFYPELTSGTSIFFYNLYLILKKYQIASEFLIIFTNQFGLKKEIDLLNSKTNYTIKNIIETSLWFDFPTVEKIKDFAENHNFIKDQKFLYTCLNNIERIHRSYTLCKLKENNLLDNGIISYRFKK